MVDPEEGNGKDYYTLYDAVLSTLYMYIYILARPICISFGYIIRTRVRQVRLMRCVVWCEKSGPSSSGASEPEIRRRIRSLCADDDDLPGASRPSEITSS